MRGIVVSSKRKDDVLVGLVVTKRNGNGRFCHCVLTSHHEFETLEQRSLTFRVRSFNARLNAAGVLRIVVHSSSYVL